MKTMYKLMIVCILATMFVSCEAVEGQKTFETIIIEDCEYLRKYEGYNSGFTFTHKGNCKNQFHKTGTNYAEPNTAFILYGKDSMIVIGVSGKTVKLENSQLLQLKEALNR